MVKSKLTRRQILLAGLGVGVALSGLDEFRRIRTQRAQQATLTDVLLGNSEYVEAAVNSAIEGDKEASAAIDRILADLDLTPPNEPYDREMSKTLIQCSRLATEQYLTGKFDLRYDGSIQSLPTYSDRLKDYRQVASIKGPEEVEIRDTVSIDPEWKIGDLSIPARDPLLDSANQIKNLARRLAGQTVTIRWMSPVYWGFLLTSPRNSILVLRGTQRSYEWMQTTIALQVTNPEVSEFDFEGGIHQGFATIYGELSQPTVEAVRQIDPALPLFVSGHSLGSPLSSLAALDIAQKVPTLKDRLRLYTYAGPKLGNPEFAEAHSRLVPNSYRIANLADPITLLPPIRIGDLEYVHLGQEWAFTTSRGDIGSHHYVSAYRAAVDAEREELRP
ncbi:MAG: lipase family protein [Spirulina sp.]